MADSIKIVGQILNTDIVNRYTLQDEKLLIPLLQQETFGLSQDYIEYFVYSLGGDLLNSDYNYKTYQLPYTSAYSQSLLPDLEIDPIQDIQNLGYQSGEVEVRYNFFRKIVGDPFSNQLFIQQISTDRTEIKVNSTTLSSDQLLSITTDFVAKQNSVPYYYYLLLNFGNNTQVIAVNVLSNVTEEGEASVLFKLYEPLSPNISVKNTFWIVEEVVNPYIFGLNLDKLITPSSQPILRGPNFDIDLQIKSNVPTSYNNYSQLVSSLTGSYYQATLNSLSNRGININVDYSILNEFIHYSSAENRLSNFIYKVGEINLYQTEININTPLTSSNASLKDATNRASSSLDNIISTFDGFESYLYFSSSSLTSSIKEYTLETGSFFEYLVNPYPKINHTQPYNLYSSASNTAQNWFSAASDIASAYDSQNNDILLNIIPSYIMDDESNYLQYITFINMVGQYFDNIWIYIDKITEVWDNNNNLNEGISKDLIYNWLESFGIKLYNSHGDQNILNYNVGNYSGSVIFSEDYSPSSSFLNNIPRKNLTLDTYKRLYHNLPYLFKSKGANGGLQALINIFGITGSILPIKEYGGMTDSQDLRGYNTDKISLGTNNITGSILSSIKRFETSPSSSREIKSQDLHFVDVSFSPQTQIDKAISASISAVSSSWVLDNFIGDPMCASLDTYPSLSYERDYWFPQTFNNSFDYGGFIRLIQFFDNSLFKMVEDFSPARGNTWTGISIKSPVLERPKVPQFPPVFTQNDEYEATYESHSITSVYDSYYNYLEGDKEAYYGGNISGSIVNIYDGFEEKNTNPFLVNNTDNYVPPGFISGSTDFILDSLDFFNNSDFNSLQNNISESLTSQCRNKVIPILSVDRLGRCFTSYSITESVQLQDSYLSSTAYLNPRYDGVQLYSKLFNTWSFGDNSYGKSPVIDYNTKKLGLFTEITNNIFFPNKSNINLKYLVDEKGKLTELNKRNKNWVEVQNTFKAGNTLNISQFNPQKFSNQKFTDGNKLIHESGYSYFPVFYLYGEDSSVSSSSNPYINWITQSAFVSPGGASQNVLDRFFSLTTVTGSIIPDGLPIFTSSSFNGSKWEVWNLFNYTGSTSSNGNYFHAGEGPGAIPVVTSSYYIIPEKANYQFNYDFDLVVNASASAGTAKWITGSMELWLNSATGGFSLFSKNEVPALFSGQSYRVNIGGINSGYNNIEATWDGISTYEIMNGFTVNEYNSSYDTTPINTFISPGVVYRLYTFTTVGHEIQNLNDQYDTMPGWNQEVQNLGNYWVSEYEDGNLSYNYSNVKLYTTIAQNSSTNNSNQIIKFRETVNVDPIQISVGDKIVFRFFIDTGDTDINYANLGPGGILNVKPSQGSIITDGIHICFNQQKNTFDLSSSLSPFFGPAYFFDPLNSSVSNSFSNLYNTYGDIMYPFILGANDKISIQAINKDGPTQEYTVDRVVFEGSQSLANIFIREDIDGYFNECDKFYQVVFLKRVEDETNIVVNFKKPTGKTSYGFSIPQNILPAVIDNIDIITKNVNQQLVDIGGANSDYTLIDVIVENP